MQKERHPGTFQRHQHPQDSTRKPQRQRPKGQPNRHHIPLPMPPHKLSQCIHRRVRQNIRGQSQGTLQSPLPHTPSQYHQRTPYGPQPIQHSAQGGKQPFQDHQGGHVHPWVQDPPKQKPWKVPASVLMGPPPPGISNPSAQANQSTNQPTLQPCNTPYWFPLFPPPLPPQQGACISSFLYFMVSTHMYILNTPPLLIYNKSYTSAILVSFLHFIC